MRSFRAFCPTFSQGQVSRTVKKILILLFFALICAAGAAVAQDKQFVTDELRITMRTGQGTQYQIVAMLPSGTPVQVLEQNPETGYSHVRTPAGKDGWVLTQYLQNEPIARERIATAERRAEQLAQQNAELKQQQSELRQQTGQQSGSIGQLTKKNQQLSEQLDKLQKVAAHPMQLANENQQLRERSITLEKDLQLVKQENQVLKDRSEREWFVAGAGVLLAGMLLGFILPKLRGRRKSSWEL